jgi:hypothetical protein
MASFECKFSMYESFDCHETDRDKSIANNSEERDTFASTYGFACTPNVDEYQG